MGRYQCFCNVGYRGKCCEIDMETNRELVGCNFPDNFEFKQVPIECQVDIYEGLILSLNCGRLFILTSQVMVILMSHYIILHIIV